MITNSPFIGIGHNPEGPDLPLGLGMQLAQEPAAMNTFGQLSQGEKTALISYIQSCTSGEDAQNRIADVIHQLRNNQTTF